MLDITAIMSPGSESSTQKETSATGEFCRHDGQDVTQEPADHDFVLSRGVNGAARQEAALTLEGVQVGRGALGERTVDWAEYGWFPSRLPSDEAEEDEDQ